MENDTQFVQQAKREWQDRHPLQSVCGSGFTASELSDILRRAQELKDKKHVEKKLQQARLQTILAAVELGFTHCAAGRTLEEALADARQIWEVANNETR